MLSLLLVATLVPIELEVEEEAQNSAIVSQLRPGAMVRLGRGDQPRVVISRKHFSPPVTIDARGATVPGVQIVNSSGIIWWGGTVTAGPKNYGFDVSTSRNITIRESRMTAAYRGAVISNSDNIVFRNNRMTGLQSDGINFPGTKKIQIVNNVCEDFNPRPKEFDASGRLVRDGDHPDCIQSWVSRNGRVPSDFTIRGNRITGTMQGIGLFDGPYERFWIDNNKIEVSFGHGITVNKGNGGQIKNNELRVLRDWPNHRPSIRTPNAKRVVVCGNSVEGFHKPVGTDPC